MLLYERGEYREAAAFIRRISPPTFRQIVIDLPIDRFIDSMPHSMPVLEAIYAKVRNDCILFAHRQINSRLVLTLTDRPSQGLLGLEYGLSHRGRSP